MAKPSKFITKPNRLTGKNGKDIIGYRNIFT
jgi:hypothetical protein